MSTTDFLGRAIDTVKKAIEEDTAQNYEAAYQGYYDALNWFMLALKCTRRKPRPRFPSILWRRVYA